MNIAIIGASGKAGHLIAQEALLRGHKVTAIVRNKAKLGALNVKVIQKDLFALTYDDLKHNEVIINAFGVWAVEDLPQYESSLKHLADLLSGKPNRLLVIGGAGSLYVDPQHSLRLVDTPDFPAAYKPLSQSAAASFDQLKERSDVQWTYFSPAAVFDSDGPRTGSYILGGDEMIFNDKGNPQISYADYAIAMVDEAENAAYVQRRFTAVSG